MKRSPGSLAAWPTLSAFLPPPSLQAHLWRWRPPPWGCPAMASPSPSPPPPLMPPSAMCLCWPARTAACGRRPRCCSTPLTWLMAAPAARCTPGTPPPPASSPAGSGAHSGWEGGGLHAGPKRPTVLHIAPAISQHDVLPLPTLAAAGASTAWATPPRMPLPPLWLWAALARSASLWCRTGRRASSCPSTLVSAVWASRLAWFCSSALQLRVCMLANRHAMPPSR